MSQVTDPSTEKFWETTPLFEMNREQWEAVCDGCGRCCLIKLEDEDTGDLYWTNVVCRAMDRCTGFCSDYKNRQKIVPECIVLTPENLVEKAKVLPASCGYKRLMNGQPLLDWHPLVSGTQKTVVDADISIADKTLSEDNVHDDDLPNFLVNWDQDDGTR